MFDDESPYRQLLQRKIYDILIGDKTCGKCELPDVRPPIDEVRMPYLSGSDLKELCGRFKVPGQMYLNTAYSRWNYMEMMIEHCIEAGTCPDLLTYFLNIHRFTELFEECSPADNEALSKYFQNSVVEKLNGLLYPGGVGLVLSGNRFIVKRTDESVELVDTEIEDIGIDYIEKAKKEALDDINRQQYNTSITKSCSMLEGIFAYVLKKNNRPVSTKGLQKMYSQIIELYQFHSEKEPNKYIQDMVNGLNKIVGPLSDLRGNYGDVHHEEQDVVMERHHAVLCLNAAITMGELILSLDNKSSKRLFDDKK